ncbi:glycosyltransferase family protein [Actinomyces weissii]|uniref:Uncharacterized protein n=1 Tax=Actinomyces weissii TaxID=675090 RepID=A0A7T7S2T2_9ACTO|nr:hypothetical protein [Actinomyces weissii]QQM67932.1 hypothetical protein JG540_03460 [Actinomyces weissii]
MSRTPYLMEYAKRCDAPFDLVYWDKAGVSDEIGADTYYRMKYEINENAPRALKVARKLSGYIKFRRYASEILQSQKYDGVVASTGNCAVLLGSTLLSHYRGRYVIDIRDYWREGFYPYHLREQTLIENSGLAIISSPYYRKFLGDHDFVVMHNIQSDIPVVKHNADDFSPLNSRPIVLASIGAAKNVMYDRKVIDYFANDSRFELRFSGRGYECLADYVSERGISNVKASGAFPYDETMLRYEGIDAVMCMYGNGSPYWDYALANKLYFSAQMGVPIITCVGTAMQLTSERFNFGMGLDLDDGRGKDKILSLFTPAAIQVREKGCQRFLAKVSRDMDLVDQRLAEFFDNHQTPCPKVVRYVD